MTCVIQNNHNGDVIGMCQHDSNFMTNKFYRFIRCMMFMKASESNEYDDLVGFVNGKEMYRLITRTNGSTICAYWFVDDNLVRKLTIAD